MHNVQNFVLHPCCQEKHLEVSMFFFFSLLDSKSVVCFRYISNAFLTWKTVKLASRIFHVFFLAWVLYENTLDRVVELEEATVEISEKN